MKRNIFPQLLKVLNDPSDNNTLLVEGARQVGKSYLINDCLNSLNQKYHSFDLEKNPKLRQQILKTEDFEDFKALMEDQYHVKNNSILFIDEAQESPKLASYIKSFKEDWPQIKVILTGSSLNRMFDDKTRIPVGRVKTIKVLPFSFQEFVRYTSSDELYTFLNSSPVKVPKSRHDYFIKQFDNYLSVGGYPEAVKAYSAKKDYAAVVNEIVGSLIEDFYRKENEQPELFESVLRAVANNLGYPSKYTHIDTTKYMARKIIEKMKAWHLVQEVKQHPLNPVRSDFLPKRYLHDPGVVNLYRHTNSPAISLLDTINPALRTPVGGLLENAVLINLLEGESAYKCLETWKKQTNSDIEIDFIQSYTDKDVKIPIECKAALSVKAKHYKNILHYLSLTHQNFGILVSAAPFEIFKIEDKVIFNIPVYLCTKGNIEAYIENYSKYG